MTSFGRNVRWFNKYTDEVAFCKENGFDFLQIWYDKNGFGILERDCMPLKTIYDAGFPSIIHALLDISEMTEAAPVLAGILKYLGHREIIIHPVCKNEAIDENTVVKLSDRISYVMEKLAADGTAVYLENNSRLDPIFHSIDEIEYVFSKNPGLKFLVDVAHIDSYDHLREMLKVKMPEALHISDRHMEKIHEHLPLGEGNIDFKYIFSDILKGFQGKIIFEIPETDEKIIDSFRHFKRAYSA